MDLNIKLFRRGRKDILRRTANSDKEKAFA